MVVSLLRQLRADRVRRHTRLLMRGYRRLKAHDLTRISAVKDDLSAAPIDRVAGRASRWVFGAASASAEIATRQFLLLRIAGSGLNESLLLALGTRGRARAVHGAPKQWRDVMRKHGFEVAGARSELRWQWFVLKMFMRGIAMCTSHLGRGLRALLGSERADGEHYVYFNALGPGNLPRPHADGVSHDIMSWYAQWPGRNRAVRRYSHNVGGAPKSAKGDFDVTFRRDALPELRGIIALLRYAGWTIGAVLIAFLDLLRGRWWHAVMLGEASDAAVVRVSRPEALARDFLFHNSNWVYRNLWSYEAIEKGSRVLFYFYSSNCEGFKLPHGYPPVFYGYRSMNWPHYLVWDEPHAEFVRRVVGADANVSVCGPIWFTASPASLPVGAGADAIAVFDVAAVRSSYYASLALDTEYYVPRVSRRFLDDIYAVARSAGLDVYWKRKRKMASTTHVAYRQFADRYSAREGVMSVDTEVSAYRVIEVSCMVISMPFTSTALIAQELGKPSCYYDPTGQLQSDDRAAHGIPIVQGREALAAWVRQHAAMPSRLSRINQ